MWYMYHIDKVYVIQCIESKGEEKLYVIHVPQRKSVSKKKYMWYNEEKEMEKDRVEYTEVD